MTVTAQTDTRERLRVLVESDRFKNTIMAVIIINALTLGLSTSDRAVAAVGPLLSFVDTVALTIFVVELLIKFFVYRLAFFNSAWNIFDFIVVAIGLMPSGGGLSALRGLRVIRTLRLLSVVPQMRAVVQALLDALPGMGAVIIMLSIVYYVFGVMATLLFGDVFDDWFGTLGKSIYSLFQIMTLESWSMGIVRPVMKEFPYAWAFFVPFIMATTFSVLNLFIGLMVNTMQSAVNDETEAELDQLALLVKSETDIVGEQVKAMHEELKAMRAEIAALRGARDGG